MKKIITLLCIFAILFTGCTQKEETEKVNESLKKEESEDVRIVNFYKSYATSERPSTVTAPEDLPEGEVVYDNESTFKLRKDEKLNFIKYFPIEYEYTDISPIYSGDIPQSAYENAFEWISVLYEAEKLKEYGQMKANIKHRTNLLSEACEEYVNGEFLEAHTQSMYHYNDVKHCALTAKMANKKVYFQQYKTHYIDSSGNKYYGITAEMYFDSQLYSKARQVPNYIAEKDMGFQLYIEVLFDSENKIAGWIEEFYKASEKEQPYSYFIISPEKAGYMEREGYFSYVFDETFGTAEDVVFTKYKDEMFNIEKELMYILKDNTELNEETFYNFKNRCARVFASSKAVNEFLSDFLYDVRKYNVHFEFDPFTIIELDEKENVVIKEYKDTKYGDVYYYSSGGLKKTGSQEFNEKYALGPEWHSFSIAYYFVEEDGEIKLLGMMLQKYNRELDETLSDNLISLWNGIKPPIIEEEQG